LHLSLNGFP